MSGICIGVAGFGFLALKASDQFLAGCVIFAVALISVVCYKLWLYTGTAGFIKKNEFGLLGLVLLICRSLLLGIGRLLPGRLLLGLIARLLIQPDRIPMFLTAKAIKSSVIRVQTHRRRIFGMEKAASETPAA